MEKLNMILLAVASLASAFVIVAKLTKNKKDDKIAQKIHNFVNTFKDLLSGKQPEEAKEEDESTEETK